MALSLVLTPLPFISFPFSVLIGEIDESIDKSVDPSTIRAEPIMPIRY